MSILTDIENWVITNTIDAATPTPPPKPPSDDCLLALLFFLSFLGVTAALCGHYLAH